MTFLGRWRGLLLFRKGCGRRGSFPFTEISDFIPIEEYRLEDAQEARESAHFVVTFQRKCLNKIAGRNPKSVAVEIDWTSVEPIHF